MPRQISSRLLWLGFILLMVGGVIITMKISNSQNQNQILGTRIKVGEQIISVEMADTPSKRIQGLSGRPSLEAGTGMLFVFDEPEMYSFWMKDMNFPIDIIWIDSEYKVVSIARNIDPSSYPTPYHSSGPAQYVLELNAGDVDRFSIQVGEEVYIISD